MSSVTVQVMDQHGGHINFLRNIVTGFIHIDIYDARNGEEKSMVVDPDEPEVKKFLKETLQPIQLEILLDQ